MSIAQADLEQAVNAAWDASTLDVLFQALWATGVQTAEFPVLHDQQAGGEQPHPYCVYEIGSGITTTRMSKAVNDNWETRDVPLTFKGLATDVAGDARSAKAIAAYLIEEIMRVFGGHPTQAPSGTLTMINGNHLITTYQNDYAIREGEDNYMWMLSYSVRLDVPVMHTSV